MPLTIHQWARWAAALGSAFTGQLARPTSTVAAGSWTAVGAASLHAATSDESNTTYARSSVGTATDAVTLGLGTMTTPDAGDVTIYVRHRLEP